MPDAVTFPGVASPLPRPVPGRSWQKRLPFMGLAAINRLVPKTPSKVVLHSSVDVEDGVVAVAAEVAARGHRAIVLLENRRRGPLVHRLSPVPVITAPKWSVRGILHYLTARHVMTTNNIHGGMRPPQSQTVVALWHGEPPTKAAGRFNRKPGLKASLAPVCSTVGRAYRSAEFDIHPLRVPIVGAPRNDRMVQADRDAMRRAMLDGDVDRTTILWMPSWRSDDLADVPQADGRPTGAPFPREYLRRVDDFLVERGARMVVKLHHRDRGDFSGDYRAIRVLEKDELERRGVTLYQALAAFDALITDMSSIWVDWLLLDKPLLFAFPDIDGYRYVRGLNLEPYEQWVPGPFARSADELVAALTDVVEGRDPMAEERRRARVRLHQFDDSRSAVRLLDGLGYPHT